MYDTLNLNMYEQLKKSFEQEQPSFEQVKRSLEQVVIKEKYKHVLWDLEQVKRSFEQVKHFHNQKTRQTLVWTGKKIIWTNDN